MSQKKVNSKLQFAAKSAEIAPKPLISGKYLPWILIALLFVIVSALYFPIAYQNMEPQPTDISQWRGAAKSIIDYNAEHEDPALWTQNMFSGMPSYMISFPNRYPFLESLTKLTDKVINWRIFLLFIGGLGVFLLLRQLKMDPWLCFFGAIAFIFSSHWAGLLEIGHNTKFRAIMYIPWVVWAVMRLKAKPNLLSLGLLATFLITQLRENHPQITYYLYLLIGMYWIYQLIEGIRSKELKKFGIWTLLLILAFGLTALAVMNPYLSTLEYSQYTMRGGAEGLDKAYAQGWSFHPKEIIGLIIPDFWGGINQTYWGYMPFTQVYNYFGILVLAFGILALWGKRKGLAIFLWVSSFIFTLMSFGSATPALSDLFFKYLPMFNKFRVPSMTLTIVQFNAVILAALGLKSVIDNIGNSVWQKRYLRIFWVCGAVYILWLIFAKSLFAGLPFTTLTEQARYEQANALSRLEGLKALRLEALFKSGFLALMFLAVGMGLAYLASIKKLKTSYFILLISIITFADLWPYTGKHLKNETLKPHSDREISFQKQDYDDFLLQDKENFRIYPSDPLRTNKLRPAGEWAYYHQSIEGYSAAKLQRYDDILEVIKGDGQRDGEFLRYLRAVYQESVEAPTPVLDMLSTKYVIVPDSLPYGSLFQNLRPVYYNGRLSIYENLMRLPRAWFVQDIQVVDSAEDALAALWDPDFDPATTAILESPIEGFTPPQEARVKQAVAGMHELVYEYTSDTDAFLVLSEVYYPAGWKAYLDDEPIPIHPTNYILRGLKVPAGHHTLRLSLEPESYRQSVKLSLAGLSLTILAVLIGLIWQLIRRKKEVSA
ncbi:MAG: hypothetical protein PHY24_06760 [Candidatus Cloacimonetes bacterium]|nr:hypothetical protein [Candidatus Cloacimonadota bacterium]MDD3533913.1 hypothetical protein [Candidatus Cloacimonadota bacterium]